MNQHDLLNKLFQKLYSEKLNFDVETNSPPRISINADRADLLTLVKEADKTRNIDLILEVERAFLVNDLTLYGNSDVMKGSLNNAIVGVDQTKEMLTLVREPAKYAVVNKSYALKDSRKAGVPYDEARKFFPGEVTRLRNMDKSRLSAEEKKIITARQDMLRTGEKIYKGLQNTALGISPQSASRDKSHGMEM